jgi:hypothetical protein
MVEARKWGYENKETTVFSCPHFLANSCSFTTWRVSGMCDVTEMVKRKNGNAEAQRTLRLFYLEVVVVAVLCGLAVWTLRSTSLSLRS